MDRAMRLKKLLPLKLGRMEPGQCCSPQFSFHMACPYCGMRYCPAGSQPVPGSKLMRCRRCGGYMFRSKHAA